MKTYSINVEEHKFLMKLARADTYEKFRYIILEKECKIAKESNIYIPFYDTEKYQSRMIEHY